MRVFVDTSGFAALENRTDAHHEVAVDAYRGLIEDRAVLLTSDYVFDEVLTLLKRRASPEVALDWGRRLLASTLFELVIVDRDLLEAGLEVFAGALDQPFSFTDCTSFALMRAAGIDTALAFDDDFRRYGFGRVP